jgi:predicted alpha/beta-hydrolase family hydrolase
MPVAESPVTIAVGDLQVSAVHARPENAFATLVVAHGAGAGMEHPFLSGFTRALNDDGVATLRFNFPYREAGRKFPDRPPLAIAAWRATMETARASASDGEPLWAAGKSFGGRMASQAQAERPLPGVRGLAFLAFPLHPAKKPSTERADHLARVDVPMLFLQGTRDALAEMPLLAATVQRLGGRATLAPPDDADHAFHVPAKSGRSDGQVLDEGLDAMVTWVDGVLRSMP